MFNIKSASPMCIHFFIAVFWVLVLSQWGHCESGASFMVVTAVTSPTNDAKESEDKETKRDREQDILSAPFRECGHALGTLCGDLPG
jgi:hypothetical protein